MNEKYVDLSLSLETNQSEPEPIQIEFISHEDGAKILTKNSRVDPQAFPEGKAINFERVCLTSHSGTHVDAPLHYGPYYKGTKSRPIDEMPLDWFYGPSFVLDCKKPSLSSTITDEEIHEALVRQNLKVSTKDIVLIYTGADSLWGKPEYFTNFRGMSLSACEYLLNLGVCVIGIDSFGFDAPFNEMLRAYEKSADKKSLWPCHMLGRKKEYCQIERLANLGTLPKNKKFYISCFPIKLKGCGAAPARVVAIIKEE